MAKAVFLEFEKSLGEISAKIDALENDELESNVSHRTEILALERELTRSTSEIYRELTPWQTSLVARHPNRPYTLDYINAIFEDFTELHGDRMYADDSSIVGGLARLAEHSVMVIGHQKGRDTRERTKRNFGMSRPEGYRKALRLMKLAEKFNLPVFTFVDTPGAYPGIGAEERNQSEAIGRNIFELSKLRVPVISTIIGEGGSGGALAIAVADVVMMLQYSTYSVISPEGCASILWKDAQKAPAAAEALGLTANTLQQLGLVDKIISEPLGGAHRDPQLMARTLKKVLIDQLRTMLSLTTEELIDRRLDRLLSYGKFETSQPSSSAQVAETERDRTESQNDLDGEARVKPESVLTQEAQKQEPVIAPEAKTVTEEEETKPKASRRRTVKPRAKPTEGKVAAKTTRTSSRKKTVKQTEEPKKSEDVN